MTLSFNMICALVVVGSLITTLVIGPLMWDAAEYVQNILENAYNMENYSR